MSLLERAKAPTKRGELRKAIEAARREGAELRRHLKALTLDLQRTHARLAALEGELERRDGAIDGTLEALHACVASVAKGSPELARLDYRRFARLFRRRLSAALPRQAIVLVATKGDASLLDLPVPHAGHFPQDIDEEYAGCHPADDLSAIAHLEALRHDGYDTLVLPAFVHWWLDHYRGLRQHLRDHYAELRTDELCTVYDLRCERRGRAQGPVRATLHRLLQEAERRVGRQPDLLDWRTGANLRQRFPTFAVAASSADTLPHIDRSIDVVVVANNDPEAHREAQRVATVAVIELDGDRVADVDWLAGAPPSATAGFDVLVTASDAHGRDRAWSLDEQIRRGLTRDGQQLDEAPPAAVDDGRAGIRLQLSGSDELVVWIAEGVLLLPGSLRALVDTFGRFPEVGAVGGRVLDCTGRLLQSGGALTPDGCLVQIGSGDWHPAHARYSFVRRVDFCSSVFMAARRRAVADAGDIDRGWPAGAFRDADFCLRLRQRGYATCLQPEATAVCGVRLTRALRHSAKAESAGGARAAFAQRWRAVLQTRRSALDEWAI